MKMLTKMENGTDLQRGTEIPHLAKTSQYSLLLESNTRTVLFSFYLCKCQVMKTLLPQYCKKVNPGLETEIKQQCVNSGLREAQDLENYKKCFL